MDLPKIEIDEKDLLQLLNWELAAYEECAGCRFTAVDAAERLDGEGCNWVDARLEVEAPIGLTGQIIAHRVVEQTRRSFNVTAARSSPA